jgi:hypothetical protein
MAYRNIRVSDISGTEIDEASAVEIVIRRHPHLDESRRLDASEAEIAGLRTMDDLVSLQVRRANGTVDQVFCTLAGFRQVVPDSALEGATSTRGRRPGYRPRGNSTRR